MIFNFQESTYHLYSPILISVPLRFDLMRCATKIIQNLSQVSVSRAESKLLVDAFVLVRMRHELSTDEHEDVACLTVNTYCLSISSGHTLMLYRICKFSLMDAVFFQFGTSL